MFNIHQKNNEIKQGLEILRNLVLRSRVPRDGYWGGCNLIRRIKSVGCRRLSTFPGTFPTSLLPLQNFWRREKNPWHWQQREPTYRLGHLWDRWWIGGNFRGIEGLSSRVQPPQTSLVVKTEVDGGQPFHSGPYASLWHSRRGRRRETMWFTTQIHLQIHLCSGVAPLPNIPQDLSRHRSTWLHFAASICSHSLSLSLVFRCGCFFVRYSSNLITKALKFPWIMAKCTLPEPSAFYSDQR